MQNVLALSASRVQIGISHHTALSALAPAAHPCRGTLSQGHEVHLISISSVALKLLLHVSNVRLL